MHFVFNPLITQKQQPRMHYHDNDYLQVTITSHRHLYDRVNVSFNIAIIVAFALHFKCRAFVLCNCGTLI